MSLTLTSPSLGAGARGRHVTLRGLVCLSVLRLHFTDDTAALQDAWVQVSCREPCLLPSWCLTGDRSWLRAWSDPGLGRAH